MYNYIIVGAGSAGCVLAYRLSENPENQVLILEAGGSDKHPFVRVPAGEIKAIQSNQFNWNYKAERDPSLNNRANIWPAGKVLGGSSSINGMVYIRGQKEDYDSWSSLISNTGEWSYEDVLTYFKRMEKNPIENDQYHGQKGPLEVSNVPTPHPITKAFIDSAISQGIPFNPDVNGEKQEGVGPNQGTIKNGGRNNSARAFLDKAKKRKNLTIIKNALVDKILLDENNKAIAVKFKQNNSIKEIKCINEIILSSGALSSPTILMRSGIGPAKHLQELGIEVKKNLPGVGENLQEHPACWISAEVNLSTYNVETSPYYFLKHGLNWIFRGKGPASSPISQAVAFFRTRPDSETRPDIQLHFMPMGWEVHEKYGLRLLEKPAVTIQSYVCRPNSRGKIKLNSKEFNVPPKIITNLIGDEEDMQRLVSSLKIVVNIFKSKPFSKYFKKLIRPTKNFETDEEIRDFIGKYAEGAYHPVGTCKMGNDDHSVVDKNLCVRGVYGLRVADASIMPIIPSGNTNAPSMMVGEKASDLILNFERK